MDERTWLATDDAYAMLDDLFPYDGVESVEPQPRPSRLYLIACARRAWDRLPGVCRAVVALAERAYALRELDCDARRRAYGLAESLVNCLGDEDTLEVIGKRLMLEGFATADEVRAGGAVAPELWEGYSHLAFYPFSDPLPYFRRVPPDLHSADLIREVFGNPFRRLPPMPDRWRTGTVINLARQAGADFAILPVLADALEDAGCDRRDVLDHLRHGGPHVCGCWALEWVIAPPTRLQLPFA